MKLLLVPLVISSLLVTGCSQRVEPKPTYDIQKPIQTTVDFLAGTRHYQNQDIRDESLFWFYQSKLVKVSNGSGWQQLFAELPLEFSREQRSLLNQNLSRTCWSLKKDAILQPVSQAHRAAVGTNIIYACTSKRLGNDYPLFTVSYINDPVTKPYLTLLVPTEHYSSTNYICKAKREGYEFKQSVLCI